MLDQRVQYKYPNLPSQDYTFKFNLAIVISHPIPWREVKL